MFGQLRVCTMRVVGGAMILPMLIAGAHPTAATAQGVSLVSPDGSVDWNRYYTASETTWILQEFHRLYPELTELTEIGKSYLGAPLLLMEVTNERTGGAREKPALYLDGGIHAAELTGSAVALYVLGQLLAGYGSDPRITDLLDQEAFYIRPKFNPDGSDLVLMQDEPLRSSVRPIDEDGDGRADEDPPQDLDGDGWITSMRVADERGPWYADPSDPRLMRRITDESPAPEGASRYRILREGMDDDGDGRLDEDGVGGLDMNRNFPRNWELEYLQPGAGPFPLSEPETYATVEFIDQHPNIVGIVHGHTSGGFVYRLPSASDPSRFPTEDLDLIQYLGAEYTRTTGRPVRPSSTHPTNHRYGTLISWGYWDRGIVGWVPEYSPGPEAWVTDFDEDGRISADEEMRFDDEVLGGRYFSPWTPYDHPDLGPVEIGGWHTRFWGQNPPPEYLEAEARVQLPWILFLAAQAPRLTLSDPRVVPLGSNRYRIQVTVRNEGFLPTSLTSRGAVGRPTQDGGARDLVVPSPTVTLELEGAILDAGSARTPVGHLAGTSPFVPSVPERERTLTWTVERTGSESVFRVTASSPKAGIAHSAWVRLR